MKHKSVIITLKELMVRTEGSCISEQIAEDLNLGHLAPHDADCACGGDSEVSKTCTGYRLFTTVELNMPIKISWPDHVLLARFNGDANYQRA